MIDKTPTITEPVRQLMAMDCEVVSAKHIAPVVKMSESVIIHRVKSGEWDPEILGKYVISGNRVKFFRKDFLQKCGFLQPEKEEKNDHLLLKELVVRLSIIQDALLCMMTDEQRLNLAAVLNEKTASAATPAE